MKKTILCKALSKNLEIPAAHMDFSVEMEAKEKDALYWKTHSYGSESDK